MIPRIFVGTMYSGEAELEACQHAVASQKGVQTFHHVIKNLPEREAHNELTRSWEKNKKNFDLFAKIDADTILVDDTALARVWDLFASDPRVTGVQIRLLDYFTDQLISGLNFFSPKVKFKKSKDDLFCDRIDTNHDKVLKGDVVKHLEPIGYHCKTPHPEQAFHYGLHRMLKGQKQVIKDTFEAWKKYQDEPRMWALLGAMEAKHFTKGRFNYTDQEFQKLFSTLKIEAPVQSQVSSFVAALV